MAAVEHVFEKIARATDGHNRLTREKPRSGRAILGRHALVAELVDAQG